VWITGASRGLGRALAFASAGAGAQLLLSARDGERLAAVAGLITDAGGRAEICAGSVTDPEHLREAIGLAQATWGRIDVLVNNAGISPSFDRAEKLDLTEFQQTLSVNLTGALACCRAALPLLARSGAGASVVNISSIHANAAHERLVAYSASKAGLEMMSRTLALEWAKRGIRVNCVAPGYIETDMTAGLQGSERLSDDLLSRIPLGRFAGVSEIVGSVLFCAGDASRYMTGATLTIDGGWSAR
jgi:NAD(P)-dependent dehydrogenase (short-subunit alcohol dehydrogenase family)